MLANIFFFFAFLCLGFNPSWNARFQFDVYVPELALVRFVVEDHDTTSSNEFVGQYTLPFTSIQRGKSLMWCVQFNTHQSVSPVERSPSGTTEAP